MTATLRPTTLTDEQTLIERAAFTAGVERGLREQPVWQQAGETERRRAAKRLAFVRWCYESGEIGDGEGEER